MAEDIKRNCKFFKQHFIYNSHIQKFREIDCGHCTQFLLRKNCINCKFFTPEIKNEFIDASMIEKMNAILRTSHQIIDLLEQKNSE